MQDSFKKRVLFVGMPDLGVICLNYLALSGVNIVGVVPPCRFEPSSEMMINACNALGLNCIIPDSLREPGFLSAVKDLNADIAVVCSYNKLFPKEFLETTKDGFLNVHPSFLPNYRGANPYSNVIINGEKLSGVTIHFMDEGFDTGDIVYQEYFEVAEDETMGTLFNKSNYISSNMLLTLLRRYEKDSNLPRQKQPDGEFKKAKKIDISLGNNLINWDKSAEDIDRFVRGLNPFIGAFTFYNGIFLKIHTAKPDNKTYKASPGEIVEAKDKLVIACKQGSLEIKTLQFGSYIICDGKEFITRFKPQKGTILSNAQNE